MDDTYIRRLEYIFNINESAISLDKKNWSPLNVAILNVFNVIDPAIVNSCVQKFINFGTNINARCEYNECKTIMHFELEKEHPSINVIQLLLQNGARIDIPDAKGRTAIDLAKEIKNTDIKAAIQMKMQLYEEST